MSMIEIGAKNPGIVPPWLTSPIKTQVVDNPGIVPPWLQDPDTPRILGSTPNMRVQTTFVSQPVDNSPSWAGIPRL